MNPVPTSQSETEARGRFEVVDGIEWYIIEDYDVLDPFLVALVTPDDQWAYLSSSGALSAGRRSAEYALFPYETDDRLHRSGGQTGPLTIVRIAGVADAWQPFAPSAPFGEVQRSMAKSTTGDRLRFCEYHPSLGLTFHYTWATAGQHGLVRRCELTLDKGRETIEVELLDGLVDILPAGVELATQQTSSTLIDAYRRCELDPDVGLKSDIELGVFTLEALISDRADPAESLTATVVWMHGLADATIALSDRQVRRFRSGSTLESECLVTGRKGAFLASSTATLEPGVPLRWTMVADVDRDHVELTALRRRVLDGTGAIGEVERAVEASTAELVAIVAVADGPQETADRRTTAHHFANTLFNSMRGGVFLDDHRVELADVDRFIGERNRSVHPRFAPAIEGLDPVVELDALRAAVANDPDLARLVCEYLPLTFSRRHGDPSRPWNTFQIPAREPGRPPAKGYEGNWRDIFQNWDALTHSFPNYIESVIAKFLNASTLDGHNPYRVTENGIDWEVPEAGSWGNFGYWGDHQIVYLHRLLLAAERFHPGLLESKLDDCSFSYGDVPYRLLSYEELVADPKRTLVFDEERQAAIEERVRSLGADGRLVPAAGLDGGGVADAPGVHLATMAEKLLVPALAKLSNLVAGAGIWLNTQRPEWNDANNALVGNGVSTVTLFHLRDYLAFLDEILAETSGTVRIGRPVLQWIADLQTAFEAHSPAIDAGDSGDGRRRSLLDQIGRAFETYRSTIYIDGPDIALPVDPELLRRVLAAARPHLDAAVDASLRPDGLFHAYWSLHLGNGVAGVEPLYEMLEGQAAAIASPDCDPATALRLVDALFDSEMYRPDQGSFLLYPNHPPAPFRDKNRVPDELVGPSMAALLDLDSGIVARDADGTVRFRPELRSGRHLSAALDRLETDPKAGAPGAIARSEIEAAYETVFNHRAFTGRSHTMYGYEGLGSIYWHMVSKLLLSLQERLIAAKDEGAEAELVAALADRYRRVRSGLGFMKTAAEQGSFPADPHSHTPAGSGAQQPGMTGQVKEGVLIRWSELGVEVRDGRVRFRPLLLDRREFLSEPRPWSPLGGDGQLDAGTLGFTYCGAPVVYHLYDGEPWVRVTWSDGRQKETDGPALDGETSRILFGRTGLIARIDVGVPSGSLILGG